MALSKIKTNSIDDSAITNAKITDSTIDVTAKITGSVPTGNLPTIPVTKGGTGLTSIGSANQAMTVNSGASALEFSMIKKAGKESIWVPASAMYPNTTSGCADLAQTELGNGP